MPVYKGGKEYSADDMKEVYSKGDWKDWEDIILWLELSGRSDPDLMDGKVGKIIFQLKQLQEKNIPFVTDYKEAFQLAQKHNQL